LTFFAEVAGSVSGVEQNILLANPILEAFGNAKTLRNNNSSRFGKYIEVHFDPQGKICGASTINYLLEKSRVCFQLEGERAFHIFYQLCLGADETLRYELYLDQPDQFYFLTRSSCVTLDEVDDVKEFEEMCDAMRKLNFTEAEMKLVFRTVAAVLHLGNLEFEPGAAARTESSKVSNPGVLKIAAEMLGVAPDALNLALTTRLMEIRGQAATSIPLSVEKADDTRNAMAKTIYYRMFDWLVQRINQSMVPKSGLTTTTIGVLDIFGFEIFDMNSFEQLCINFANEKLQQHFNQHTFKLEEQLYQREGIKYDHIEFIDNQPVLDMIEAKRPQGILIALDEEIVVPRGTDATFLQKINKTHGEGHTSCFKQMLQSRTQFGVEHYAGPVTYESTGFLDKNKDRLNKICLDCMAASSDTFVKTLFPATESTQTRRVTLGGQFRNNLNDLMKRLNETDPHYIRCVKPNNTKAANDFQGTMCLQQLRYAGVFEAVAIRKQGFPFRYTHDDFVARYGFIYPQLAAQHKGAVKQHCQALLDAVPHNLSAAQIGRTRVLYRATEHRSLELVRSVEVEKKVVIMQAYHHGWQSRALARRLLEVRPILRQAMAQRTVEALGDAIQRSAHVEFPLRELTQARALKVQVEREIDITARLEALHAQDPEVAYDQMRAATDEAAEINFASALIAECRQTVELVAARREARKELADATEKAERGRLEAGLARAAELTMAPAAEETVRAAQAELARIEQEEAHVAALDAAMNEGYAVEWDHSYIQVDALVAAHSAAAAFQCRTEAGARRVQEAGLLIEVRNCLVAEDWPTLGTHLRQCVSIGYNSQEIIEAQDELSHKVATDEVEERLIAAVAAHDQDELAYGLEQADRLQMTHEVVEQARQLLAHIVEARRLIEEAVAAVSEGLLDGAMQYCDAFSYSTDQVEQACALLSRVRDIKKDAATGLHYTEREYLERALAGAEEIGYQTDEIDDVRGVLSLGEEKFLQMQLKTAKGLHDPARAIRIMIKLKNVFFESHGKMIVFKQYGNLREPIQYANAQLLPIGRDKLRLGMLQWTKKPIPTSLTNMTATFAKRAVKLFKNILGFMGDRSLSYPQMLAQDLLNQCLETAELRDEIYCQVCSRTRGRKRGGTRQYREKEGEETNLRFCKIIKQLTLNPNPQSVSKGWQLLEFCLQTFAPGDDFGNYLEMYLRRNGKNEKYVWMLHDTQYGPQKTTAPLVDTLMASTNYQPMIDVDAATEINPNDVIITDVSELKAALPPSLGFGGAPVAASSSSAAAGGESTQAAAMAAAAQFVPPPAAEPEPEPEQYQPPPPVENEYSVVTALYDYEAQDFRQLSIVAGEQLYLIGPSEYEGWSMCMKMDGSDTQNIVPSNYLSS
jgi:Myosin head (motor domain)/MyTH4 domain